VFLQTREAAVREKLVSHDGEGTLASLTKELEYAGQRRNGKEKHPEVVRDRV